MSFTFIGITPAVCDASTINKRLCFRAICPIDLISTTLPVRFEACVQTMAFVSGRIKASMSDGEIIPFYACITAWYNIHTHAPLPLHIKRSEHRIMLELCCNHMLPGSNSPWIAMFSASVAFAVKRVWPHHLRRKFCKAHSGLIYFPRRIKRCIRCPAPGIAAVLHCIKHCIIYRIRLLIVVAALSR